MKFNVIVKKPIHTIEADTLEEAEKILEEQYHKYQPELYTPFSDLDDLTLVPAPEETAVK